jgi:tetratricopeptide (TPR) repeat protein
MLTAQLVPRLHAPFFSFIRTPSSMTRRLSISSALACALFAPLAHAQVDAYSDVSRLLRAGQHTEALAKADQYLATKPRDPQMRFIKGVIQSESGKSSEAIATFTRLTEDFPELPEPYNNLAVLYAAQGQYDKARSVLEMAIRTHPSYATAQENLGDVYAKLASQAYSKALQLDAGNPAVTPKLSLIRNLFNQDARKDRPASVEPVAESKPVARPTQTASTIAAAPTAPVVVAPAPEKPAPAKPAASSRDSKNDVKAAVLAWAKAWSAKDMNGYLGAYAAGFTPPGGQTRSAWEADRKARILPRSRINVTISQLEVTVHSDGQRATAQFRQAYSSDTVNVASRKSLDLVKVGGRWLILRESTGS